MLVNEESGGWPQDRVTSLSNPVDCRRVISDLRRIAQDTDGVLLVYFVGHGTVSTNGELVLAVTDTVADEADVTGLEYSKIRTALLGSPAKVKAVVLDCCYSGRAIDVLAGDEQFLADSTDIRGTYTLTAADHVAHAGRPGACTAFTRELLDLIGTGIAGAPPVLTFADLYPHLRRNLVARNLPYPNQRGTDTADRCPVAKNASTNADSAAPRLGLPAETGRPALMVPQHATPLPVRVLQRDEPARLQPPEPRHGIRRRTLVLGTLAVFGAGAAGAAVKWWPDDAEATITLTGDETYFLAFSPDSKTLAGSGPKDGVDEIRLWDAATGRSIATLTDTPSVTGLAFSPDGKTLASSHFAGIRLRDATTGVIRVNLSDEDCSTVAFSPDGKILASSHSNSEIGGESGPPPGRIRLWNTSTQRTTTSLTYPTRSMGVQRLAFSPDGKTLAACSASTGTPAPGSWLWDIATGRTKFTFYREESNDIAFRPDGKAVVTAGTSGVRLWNTVTGKVLTTYTGQQTSAIAFSPDGTKLATAGNGGIRLWNTATGRSESILSDNGEKDGGYAVAFRPDGKAIASSAHGAVVLRKIQ
ncbi:translation initiation factor eIF2A [Actinacidiphila alni]|uniref:Translation initiation factor eIF2A n=2 Tax=Actinacidiphila alni TaxID=380248 RepID=A0A1I2MKA1_9ACTN|nr:translation initiation factor eIF2A [Actinacidiphila alni]